MDGNTILISFDHVVAIVRKKGATTVATNHVEWTVKETPAQIMDKFPPTFSVQ